MVVVVVETKGTSDDEGESDEGDLEGEWTTRQDMHNSESEGRSAREFTTLSLSIYFIATAGTLTVTQHFTITHKM